MADTINKTLLKIDKLDVRFHVKQRDIHAVKQISFSIEKGQSIGIVGESGSGKSVTSLSLLDLFRKNESVHRNGAVELAIGDQLFILNEISDEVLNGIRGRQIGLVLQEPGSTLNPARKCGRQIEEVLRIHKIGDQSKKKEIVLEALGKVALSDTDRIYNSYPHELSGGELQRVCIAMAIICNPLLLICDEVTSSLDVTIQKEIIDLLKELRQHLNLTLLFISHDLDVVKELCDHVLIMKDGKIIERGKTLTIFSNPQQTYTQELLDNKPSLSQNMVNSSVEISDDKILIINDLGHRYRTKRKSILRSVEYDTVLHAISFSLRKSEILGIVGESGSGKTTIAKAIVGMIKPTKGEINYYTADHKLVRLGIKPRRDIQLIFQDPYSALNPSMFIGKSLYELISFHGLYSKSEIDNRISILLNQVGLSNDYYDRLPQALSGGQRQRVCIAKALALEPRILICDECVSALDVTVQAQILELLLKIRDELDLSLLFISHDLAVINIICDRVIVISSGEIVESGSPQDIIHNPQNTYTKELIQSIPGFQAN